MTQLQPEVKEEGEEVKEEEEKSRKRDGERKKQVVDEGINLIL